MFKVLTRMQLVPLWHVLLRSLTLAGEILEGTQTWSGLKNVSFDL